MRITIANQFYHPYHEGGAEKSVQFLAETLKDRGNEVTVVTTTCDGAENSVDLNGVTIKYYNQPNICNSHPVRPTGVKKLIWHLLDAYNPTGHAFWTRILKETRPDVLHTNMLGGLSCAAWSAASALGIPVVHTLRDYHLLCPKNSMFKDGKDCVTPCARCQVFAAPKKWLSKKVQVAVGNSRKTLDRHLENGFFPNAEPRVIHNMFSPSAGSRKAPSTGASGPILLGYFGAINEKKGFGLLLQCLAAQPKGKFRLLVGGKMRDDMSPEWKSWADTVQPEFLGWTTPRDFFGKIDCLVAPAIWQEPLPRVIIESINFGVPVVATDVGGQAELIVDGVNGVLVKNATPAELGDALLALDRPTIERLAAGCELSDSMFLPELISGQYIDAYQRARELMTR
ncbi:MAG: glycosyltransferase family 4 protein [Verrucomicrobiota bacterium]